MALTTHHIDRFVKDSWLPMEVATCVVVGSVVVLYFVRFPFLTMPVAITLWLKSMDLAAVLYSKSSWYDAHTTASALRMRLCVRHIAPNTPSHLSHIFILSTAGVHSGLQAKQLLRQALYLVTSSVTRYVTR